MPRTAKRTDSYAKKVFKASLLTALCIVPGFTCKLDTSPLRPGKPAPVQDDNDSGESK